MRGWFALAIVTGCGFHAGDDASGDAGGDDAPIVVDTPPGQICFGTSPSSLFTMCYPVNQVPATPLAIGSSRMLNTTTCTNGVVATSHGVEACVFDGSAITIASNLVATGSRPLVLVAVGDLTITMPGIVDVSSNRTRTGANVDASTCNPSGAGVAATSGGGGAAGGSFATAGGSGGAGGAVSTTAGLATASATPLTLRGGCSGSKGGDGNGNTGGAGGHSGGAVYLIAGGTIVMAGHVYASGAGGLGGDATAGAGGGGSGGLIGLDALAVTIGMNAGPPVIAANGGGGGGGGDGGNNGGDGSDGTLVSTPGAAGGPGATSPQAGDGGVGTNWANLTGGTGLPGAAGTGGGGGGGGYGAIWVVGTYSAGNGDISPQAPLLH